jgi:hypothetical protein
MTGWILNRVCVIGIGGSNGFTQARGGAALAG